MTETTLAPRAYVLGAELRDARTTAGFGLRELATKLDVSHSVVVRWELGQRVPSTESVSALCAVLGINGTTRERLMRLTREAASEPPNTVSVGATGEADQMAALLEFERMATAITEVSPVIVPGMLQTAEYASAIMRPGIPAGETDKRVMMRLGRRDLITRRRGPVRFTAIMLESALHQSIGGRYVMVDQLHFLLEMGERDNVEIRVIPRSAGWTPAHAGPFVLLEFAKAEPVVHLEHHRSSVFLREDADVKAFASARDDVEQSAMSQEDTAELIARIINQEETPK
ncbi:Helix-turn-helix domain-containing protein [Saccharopolyspora antimicrobica]|uniref:Helix-turn-helix domain-containing protein n=1 Tax=Saccharopolyspora antimicrobica TaxID=455193 RepID=A0A1I4X5X7_9PSEU|nr:helix-turn-helix transcriptional regulator [Saccharopolyspora antimicrobica]RKT84341.1 helix-turn-helix protein [Saccharopolyspora antimicrobica]SFN21398.1 Helix-turn-helix domain-containing protein [Saccharopolyspora antimicrobica]